MSSLRGLPRPGRETGASIVWGFTQKVTVVAQPSLTYAGDCNGDRGKRIDELVKGVRLSLGEIAVTECRAFDRDGDGQTTIDELITAVLSALNGC
ncbi:MAG TPA: hypothetical protein VL049_16045 [Candidatus Dormibacteraeota bacterium]|nr:hypothetical protein [Candidatus Dormibacteraeota bacterium]